MHVSKDTIASTEEKRKEKTERRKEAIARVFFVAQSSRFASPLNPHKFIAIAFVLPLATSSLDDLRKSVHQIIDKGELSHDRIFLLLAMVSWSIA
jgi:hypothetical protein